MAMGENQNERKPPAETTLHPDARGTHLEISPSGPSRHEFPAIEARRAAAGDARPPKPRDDTRNTISLLGINIDHRVQP